MQVQTFYPALSDKDLEDGHSKAVEIRGKRLMVVRRSGRLHAVENRCSHMGVPLMEGALDNGELVCPWHEARFCATSGDHKAGPGFCGLEKFQVRVRDGRIEVGLKATDVEPHPLMGKRAAAGFAAPYVASVDAVPV
jgi:nitrite reductase/ring-hydroxylating ferredoxin subunit